MNETTDSHDLQRELERYRETERVLQGVHRLLNENRAPTDALEAILELVGRAVGADRSYTFTVSADQRHSTCTYEWTSRPEYELRPLLQDVDQRGLCGWLRRFESNTSILIEDVMNPPEDLRQPAAKFARDLIKSIYVFGFFDKGKLIGYLGIDYVEKTTPLDALTRSVLEQVSSILNLFVLRHEALELWNRTMEDLPSAMFIKNVEDDLRYIRANPRYLQIFGADVLGKTDLEIFGPETGALFRQQDADCLRVGRPFVSTGPQMDYSNVAKGYYTTIKFPVSTQMGGRYIAGFITDITEEHKLRLQALDLLEKAKTAERAKSLFLASMSHEIRTPLNVIIGLVDELQHEDVSPETRKDCLSSVATASHSLLALINDVLDMSKIEAGQMSVVPAEADLVEIFDDCMKLFSESCRQVGLSLMLNIDRTLPRLLVDVTRIKQILFNLIGNAVKYTHQGGITVSCAFEKASREKGTLTFSVADTGIGIPRQDQTQIFDLFAQAANVRGSRAGNHGTGLGLALCKRLCECMGGTISLDSEPGRGTTFTVILKDVPMASESVSEVAPSSAAESFADTAAIGRVLIVDDVPMNLKVLGLILHRAGIEAIPAGSGEEALRKMGEENVSFVLTDLWMPQMNGEDLARAIRANPAWAHVRIAAQTADVEANNNFDTSLFDAVIAKPVTAEKVLSFLRS